MSNDSPRWEHFEHKADMGIRGIGPTVDEAFTQAALALTAVITSPAEIEPLEQVDIECDAPDLELLLPDFLNAIIFEMATRSMLFGKFSVTITDTTLKASLFGEPVSILKHAPAVEIKGATYTALSVTKNDSGLWTAQCVVDV